jgi:hypothetical protein
MHCGCDFSIKTLQHASKETREHTCWFFTAVSTFLCDQQKTKCRFFTQDTVANHTPKKNMYIGLTAVATVHMGKGITHMIYVRTFSFRSALGNRKVAMGQIFLRVTLFPLSVSFHQCSILIFTYMFAYQKDKRAKRGNIQSKHFWVSKGVRRVGYWTKQCFHIEMKAVCRQCHLLTHRLPCPCSAFRPQLPRVHPSGAETAQTALNVRFNSALRHSDSQGGDSVVVSTPCSTDLDTVPSTLFIKKASSNAQYALSEPKQP